MLLLCNTGKQLEHFDPQSKLVYTVVITEKYVTVIKGEKSYNSKEFMSSSTFYMVL
jgi:hypothetical protein